MNGEGIGVRVWRAYGMNSSWFRSQQDDRDAPYLAIPLDAATLAEMRERIFESIRPLCVGERSAMKAVDAVLAALGLEPS